MFMGAELTRGIGWLDKARMAAEARATLARLGVGIADTTRRVDGLSGGQRQAVAICRALRWDAAIIVMDEPTAALGVKESAQVLDLIRRLQADGRTIILISHTMPDVAALATRIAVMKAGRKVIDRPNRGLTADDIGHMVMSGTDKAA
jgi:ABC-type sugar transport system ATPase subunit